MQTPRLPPENWVECDREKKNDAVPSLVFKITSVQTDTESKVIFAAQVALDIHVEI
jgi:hypothetical protein